MAIAFEGSSPLTRGARYRYQRGHAQWGLIPAYAGSTASPQGTTRPSWAHPRLRGEHTRSIFWASVRPGSSPLTRGARTRTVAWVSWFGLIPAYAGSTLQKFYGLDLGRAHPRLRGEHTASGTSPDCLRGSSPLTRGALVDFTEDAAGCGLIPAYAGSTCGWLRPGLRTRAHPRLRGEHTPQGRLIVLGVGSSPLTRGALAWCDSVE